MENNKERGFAREPVYAESESSGIRRHLRLHGPLQALLGGLSLIHIYLLWVAFAGYLNLSIYLLN